MQRAQARVAPLPRQVHWPSKPWFLRAPHIWYPFPDCHAGVHWWFAMSLPFQRDQMQRGPKASKEASGGNYGKQEWEAMNQRKKHSSLLSSLGSKPQKYRSTWRKKANVEGGMETAGVCFNCSLAVSFSLLPGMLKRMVLNFHRTLNSSKAANGCQGWV